MLRQLFWFWVRPQSKWEVAVWQRVVLGMSYSFVLQASLTHIKVTMIHSNSNAVQADFEEEGGNGAEISGYVLNLSYLLHVSNSRTNSRKGEEKLFNLILIIEIDTSSVRTNSVKALGQEVPRTVSIYQAVSLYIHSILVGIIANNPGCYIEVPIDNTVPQVQCQP